MLCEVTSIIVCYLCYLLLFCWTGEENIFQFLVADLA
jgi:hypothetical protein